MDKSPLKTLTLEDFLESERHKLTGTLTPVTPESFAKWKKERLDKRAAEDEARQAKEATGRAMFEKGGWEESDEEESEDEDEGADDGTWDMEEMRRETERLKEQKERERIEAGEGTAAEQSSGTNEYRDDDNDENENDDDHEDGANPDEKGKEKEIVVVPINGHTGP